jgi:hypothetical protein
MQFETPPQAGDGKNPVVVATTQSPDPQPAGRMGHMALAVAARNGHVQSGPAVQNDDFRGNTKDTPLIIG